MIILMCIDNTCDANNFNIVQLYKIFECFNFEYIIKNLNNKNTKHQLTCIIKFFIKDVAINYNAF